MSVLTRTVGIGDLGCSDEHVPEIMDILLEEGGRFVGLGIAVVNVEDEFCCVEAECPFYYLRDSGIYVHESCCLGNQRHPLAYVGRRRF